MRRGASPVHRPRSGRLWLRLALCVCLALPLTLGSAAQSGGASPAAAPGDVRTWSCSPGYTDTCSAVGYENEYTVTWTANIESASCASETAPGNCANAMFLQLNDPNLARPYVTAAACTGGTPQLNPNGTINRIVWSFPVPDTTRCTITGDSSGQVAAGLTPGYLFTIKVDRTGENHQIVGYYAARPTPPAAAFTSAPASKEPGQFQFVSTSAGSSLVESWDFGDGKNGTGRSINHTYTKPGTFHVTLTATNGSGESNSVTHDVVVKPPELGTTIAFLDADGNVLPSITPTVGSTLRVRETVSASQNGVGSLHYVTFADAPLTVTPAGLVDLGQPRPAVPADLTLAPGGSKAFVYTATVKTAGVFHLASSVTAKDDSGASVGPATSQLSSSVAALKVVIILNPATIVQDEDKDGPKPIDVTATITVKNVTDSAVTQVNLRSLSTTPAKSGQIIKITQKTGPRPDPITGFALPPLDAGQTSAPIVAKFTATDDGEIDFASLVTAAGPVSTLRGLGAAHLSIKPKYLLKFASKVIHPDGRLLPAGQLIEVRGTVKNLSDSAKLHVGPLYPTPEGNAGLMGLAYDGKTQSPYDPAAPPPLILDPGQERSFTLLITTAYSDPRTYPEPTGAKVAKTGGTRATLTFTPWAEATLADGTTEIVRTKDVLTSDADITHNAGIDDSIAIPQTSSALLVGAFSAGVIKGIYNASVNLLWGTIQLAKLPFTSIMAAGRYEAEVWASFTPAERANFADSTVLTTVAVLRRNLGLGLRNTEALIKQVKAVTLESMTKMEDAWQTGNADETLQAYAAFGSEQIASVAVPIALAKMAKSPIAVAALTRADEAVQTLMKPLLGELAGITDIEQLGPLLKRILSGTELDPAEISKLYGISPDELSELQALATKYKFILTVRSRHASSLKWIEEAYAMLKPESLKIKTVSALDAKLGYRYDDIGSLVFRKPPALGLWEASGLGEDALPGYVRDFVRNAGFKPGTSEYLEAINRVTERSAEWNKWRKTYQQWSDQKWLPTTFNYRGNAAEVSSARNQFPKMNGFQLRKVGENDFVVEMYNYKVGRFVPVTGDIDPIAFTHLDGSPLSPAEHAALLDDMQASALLQTQHGESATFVNGGVKFVSEQFKPGEAALQIAPGRRRPRAVRLSVYESRWMGPLDYNLHWEGGFVGLGSAPDAAGYPSYLPPATRGIGVSVAAQSSGPLPLLATTNTGPTVGRCAVTYDNTTGRPLIMAKDGVISTMTAAPATVPDEADTSRCFTVGPVVPLSVRPSTQLSDTVRAGTLEIPIRSGGGLAPSNVNGDVSDRGFTVGSQIVIGAGSDDAEVRSIVGFGSLILNRPLSHVHLAGEVVITLRPGPVAAASRPSGSGSTAATGSDIAGWLWSALALLILGAAFLGAGRRETDTARTSVTGVAP